MILDLSQGEATGVVLLSLHVQNLCRGNALSRLLYLLGESRQAYDGVLDPYFR